MIDTKTAGREPTTYLRPQTFPVAIRMLKPGEPIPERAKRPARDFKKLSMACQVIDMSRRYGWMIALTRGDPICGPGALASPAGPAPGGAHVLGVHRRAVVELDALADLEGVGTPVRANLPGARRLPP